jgi:putative Ca2+/H+ antiporter (TMEM165/GDT1 family)
MPSLDAFLAALVTIFLSEVADKTQLLILGLALQFRAPLRVWAGAVSAHAIMDIAAIALGVFVGLTIPAGAVKMGVGVLFSLLGLWMLYKIFVMKAKKKKALKGIPRSAFLASFATVFAAEFGDKTQIASALLGAKYADVLALSAGTLIALGFATGLNVFLGAKIAERLPRKAIKVAAAALFLAFGLATLLF